MFIKQQVNNHYLRIDNIRLSRSSRLASKSNGRLLLNDRKDNSQTIDSIVSKIKCEQQEMYRYPERRFSQGSKSIPFHSKNQYKQPFGNGHDWQYIFRIDRIKPKQRYDCFPGHIYNTAFGSLLTGLNCINQTVGIGGDEPNVDNKQYSEHILGKIPWQIDDRLMSSTQICNNSAWNDDVGDLQQQQQQQSLGSIHCQQEDIVKILVDFLGEFLLFLSSIIEQEQFNSQFQLKKMVDVAERIHQLRSAILTQTNNINKHMTNSAIIDISSISLILHELACFIHSLSKEQQQIGTIVNHSQMITFTQLLNRLEKMIKPCTDSICPNENSQTFQTSIPTMSPCIDPAYINNTSLSSIDCLSPCNNMSNMCIPWSLLEQMKNLSEMDNLFGVVYGLKDETIRKKMGYRTGMKQEYKPDHFSNEKSNFESSGEWTTSSNNDQMSVLQQASTASMIDTSKLMTKKEINEQNRTKLLDSRGLSPLSTASIISKKSNQISKLGSNRTLSRQPSTVNSKRPLKLFSSNSDIDKSIPLRSIHDRLLASDDNRHMSTEVTSPHLGELPITSMLDHSETQRTPSRLVQEQQSNIYDESDDRNASPSQLSFQTYAYRTPTKTTYTMSRESNPSLSSEHSKSVDTRQSSKLLLSRADLSNKDVNEQKSISNLGQSIDKHSNQSLNPYKTHDSSVSLTPNDKHQRNETIFSKNWEQRLASPLSMTSTRRTDSISLKQNIISPVSSKQLQTNKTPSEFNFDDYSEFKTSPSTSFQLSETKSDVSPLSVLERPQSAEGSPLLEKTTTSEQHHIDLNDVTTQQNNTIFNRRNTSDKNKTAQISPINRHQQRSASATSSSEDSILLTRNEKQRHRSVTRKQEVLYQPKRVNMPLQSNTQGYINKFMNCFRRTIVNRVDRLEYKNK